MTTETKAEAFKRVANPRLKKARSAIRALDPMAKGHYEYTDADVQKMCSFLHEEVDKLYAVLTTKSAGDDDDIL